MSGNRVSPRLKMVQLETNFVIPPRVGWSDGQLQETVVRPLDSWMMLCSQDLSANGR